MAVDFSREIRMTGRSKKKKKGKLKDKKMKQKRWGGNFIVQMAQKGQFEFLHMCLLVENY